MSDRRQEIWSSPEYGRQPLILGGWYSRRTIRDPPPQEGIRSMPVYRLTNMGCSEVKAAEETCGLATHAPHPAAWH